MSVFINASSVIMRRPRTSCRRSAAVPPPPRLFRALPAAAALAASAAADLHPGACPSAAAVGPNENSAAAAAASATSDVGAGSDAGRWGGWRWDVRGPQRCNITRMSRSDLLHHFGVGGVPSLHSWPVVIYDAEEDGAGDINRRRRRRRNSRLLDRTSRSGLATTFESGINVTLSSSNSFSAHRRTVSLERYLEEAEGRRGGEQEAPPGETLPTQLSNETWYLFGETYGPEWAKLLLDYEMPPCQTCPDRSLAALAFGIGNMGSGVQWHTHGPGFSEALHGRKHWVMYPPEKRPTYDSDYASRHWMENHYMDLVEEGAEREDELPWECTLNPGDMVYFPDGWHHATINLDVYTAFVSTFTTEHL